SYFKGQTSFIVRQVATTSSTPVPGAIILLGSGLLYLAGIRRKRK
ncbi:MAG: PEP-CTERM sorting domain-containing protein, partial [Desulfobacula sp.]|nr:PEP-CTERM sorting domain-containing protein [Desulfobacula sp.]